MSGDVRHVFFCCVCAPALLSEPVRRFSSRSTDFSQQIAQVVLFLFLGRYAVGRKLDWKGLILCVIWETSVFVGQLLALQEGSAVGWMTMESLINFCQGKGLSCLQIIQTTSKVIPTLPPIQSILRVKQLGQEASFLCLVPGLRTSGALCAVPPHPSVDIYD